MSQDTALWSVRRPRETLGGVTNSAIPQPASALKRSVSIGGGLGSGSSTGPFSTSGGHGRSLSASRQSLAPMRPSSGATAITAATSSTNNNNNLAAELGLATGLLSVKRSSFQGARPPHLRGSSAGPAVGAGVGSSGGGADSERRSSVYRARSTAGGVGGPGGAAGHHHHPHQSFFQAAPQPAGVPRDSRPLRDRAYQARIGQELLDYLAQNNFELETRHPLSQNVVKSPTQKDFNVIFQWLYHRIDPAHKFQKNMDQEVPVILKQLRYPFERAITKSQIAAVGGQNWGTFLALLHWIMQLAQMLDGYAAHRYDDACADAGVDVAGDHIIFDFLTGAYRDWLAMDDDAADADAERVLAPHVAAMARAFERAGAGYATEAEMLQAEHTRLQAEIDDLRRATPDPAVLDSHARIMDEDRVKFEEYNGLAEQRSDKYEARARVLQLELDRMADDLRAAEEERAALQAAVDAQGISMQDIDRMTAERERLQTGADSAAARLAQVRRTVADREADAARKLDELDRLVVRYNALAYQLGLLSAEPGPGSSRDDEEADDDRDSDQDPAHHPKSDPELRILYTTSAGDPTTTSDSALAAFHPGRVLNLDLRGRVRAQLAALRSDLSERRAAAHEALLKDHELLDRIRETIEDKRGDVDALEHRVRAAEEEYDRTREVATAQKLASDAQTERLEKELARMRATLSESVQLMEQREMNTGIEYEQLVLKATALREELHTDIDRILNDVIKFKIHIQKSLEDYDALVADQLQAELDDSATKHELHDDDKAESDDGRAPGQTRGQHGDKTKSSSRPAAAQAWKPDLDPT